jgi:hypothetical protein
MNVFRVLSLSVLISCPPSAVAANDAPSFAASSTERAAILGKLRSGVWKGKAYLVGTVRVAHTKTGTIAYVYAAPYMSALNDQIYLMTETRARPWRVVWADTDGNAQSCAKLAVAFRAALDLIQSYGIAGDVFIPEIAAKAKYLVGQSRISVGQQCLGGLGLS